MTELSRRSGLPVATVHRLVRELVRWGALERDDDGTYRVGVRLWEIGSLAPIRAGLRELAIPYMEDLYEATHENVQLAVLDGLDALFVEKISGRDSTPIVTRVGGRLPLHATGVGKVLLAYAPPWVLDGLLARGLEALTPRTIVDPAELRRNLDEVRRMGFAYTRDEMTIGSVSVGAPGLRPAGDCRGRDLDRHRLQDDRRRQTCPGRADRRAWPVAPPPRSVGRRPPDRSFARRFETPPSWIVAPAEHRNRASTQWKDWVGSPEGPC